MMPSESYCRPSLWRMILGWFRSDQVRIRPSEGRVLSAQPGDRLMMEGRLYRVESRTEERNSRHANLILTLQSIDEETRVCCTTCILPDVEFGDHSEFVTRFGVKRVTTWDEGDTSRTIDEADVMVLKGAWDSVRPVSAQLARTERPSS